MKMLQAITKLIGRWKAQEDSVTMNQALYAQQAAQMSPFWASQQATTTTNTTNAWPNLGMSFGMGGAGGSLAGVPIGSGSYTYIQPTPAWSLTEEQLDRLLAFMERAMHYSWTCMKCQRQYAPITPDCEFCNFVERLEGQKDEAA